MFKLLIVSIAITYCSAGGYSNGGALALSSGYASGYDLNGGGGYGLNGGGGYGFNGGGGYGLIGDGGYGLNGGSGYGLNGGSGYGLNDGGSYGFSGGSGLGLSGLAGHGLAAGGLASGLTSLAGNTAIATPLGHSSPGPLPAAIKTHRTYEVIPVNLPQEPAVPQIIEVEPSEQPVQVIFRSISSPVHVQQIHTPGSPGQVESTRSEDEPHRVLHEVLRPVIQEVREVIQPYRRVTQEVRPVLEEVHTVVAKGEHRFKAAPHGHGVPHAIAEDVSPLAFNHGVVGHGAGYGLNGLGYDHGVGGHGVLGLAKSGYRARKGKAA